MYLVSCLNSHVGGTFDTCLQFAGSMVVEQAAMTITDLPCPAA